GSAPGVVKRLSNGLLLAPASARNGRHRYHRAPVVGDKRRPTGPRPAAERALDDDSTRSTTGGTVIAHLISSHRAGVDPATA
ncbi:MAG: hypothetical protein KDK91_31595, partial [Gammaproteobacteria bacterium]|nr:hypothetical protein [Gammaproteobacteria bacterium]